MFDYKGLKCFSGVVVCIFLIFSGCSGQHDTVAFDGGNGTSQSPYLVATAEQLNQVRHHLDEHFKQTADIDLAVHHNWPPIGPTATLSIKKIRLSKSINTIIKI